MNYRFAPPSPGSFQRHHRNRDRFGRPVYQYEIVDNGYSDVFFDYMMADPWMNVGFGDRGRGRHRRHRALGDTRSDEYDYTDSQRGDSAEGRYGRASRFNPRFEDLDRPRELGERNSNLSFGKAITKLYQQIVKSEQFYQTFKAEYDSDVKRIKKYASDESLLSLWMLRLEGKRDSEPEGVDAGDEGLVDAAERIPFMKERLRDAFSEVLISTMKSGRGRSRKEQIGHESAKRLREKISLANSQISSLLDLVPKGPEHCDALIDELGKLKVLLDPEDSKTVQLDQDQGTSNEDDNERSW